jgi:hypothetical protein
MDDFIFVAILALIYALAMLVIPYLILFVLTNVVYRLASGRFFRWVSWRTALPFLLVLISGWLFIFNSLRSTPHFLITH